MAGERVMPDELYSLKHFVGASNRLRVFRDLTQKNLGFGWWFLRGLPDRLKLICPTFHVLSERGRWQHGPMCELVGEGWRDCLRAPIFDR